MSDTQVEVVVTVPDELPRDLLVRTAMRTTLGVLVELLAESKNHVILASPFLQFANTVSRGTLGLAIRSAAARGVLIDIVSTSGSLADLDTDTLSPHREPMSVRLSQPRANLLDAEVMGSHAKLCLVDATSAYIGSANFTNNGLTKHFEVGTLVRGQAAQDLWNVVLRLFGEGFFLQRGWLTIAPDE
jgi:phosphatidylserine/phosphatidylglycerophosphate/cardiolipin synthase-like enzyme